MLCDMWPSLSGASKTRSMNNKIIFGQFSLKCNRLESTNYLIRMTDRLEEPFVDNDEYDSCQQPLVVLHLQFHDHRLLILNQYRLLPRHAQSPYVIL